MTGNRQRYTTSRFSSSGELLFNSLLDNSLHALSSVFVPFHFASPFFSILSFFSSFLSSLCCLSFSLSPLLLPSLLLLIHSGIFFHRGSERAKTSPICPPSSPPLLHSRFLPSLWALTFILFAHRSLSTFSHFRILTLSLPVPLADPLLPLRAVLNPRREMVRCTACLKCILPNVECEYIYINVYTYIRIYIEPSYSLAAPLPRPAC